MVNSIHIINILLERLISENKYLNASPCIEIKHENNKITRYHSFQKKICLTLISKVKNGETLGDLIEFGFHLTAMLVHISVNLNPEIDKDLDRLYIHSPLANERLNKFEEEKLLLFLESLYQDNLTTLADIWNYEKLLSKHPQDYFSTDWHVLIKKQFYVKNEDCKDYSFELIDTHKQLSHFIYKYFSFGFPFNMVIPWFIFKIYWQEN